MNRQPETYGRSPMMDTLHKRLRNPHRLKTYQRKMITDVQVCMAVRMYRLGLDNRLPGSPAPAYPYTTLADNLDVPEKVAYSALVRAHRNGLIDYGTSLRIGWLTDKGVLLLQENNLWEVKA